MTSTAQELLDLLVISDLHLGDKLGEKSERTLALERELCTFLEHHTHDGRHWRLVINGDMLDLVGVLLMPGDVGFVVGLHPDDHTYGLGARAHTAVLKLQLVIEHHADVFRALARFVAAGHSLVVVIGNHDIELHFPEVQEQFVQALVTLAAPPPSQVEAMCGRMAFHDWFFLEEGLAWIEHGHQYDPYCSFEDVLEPATDEQEIDPNLGALLPRYVGSQFADDIHHAWGHTFFGYLRFWAAQGQDRLVGIVVAYFDVFRRMVQHWQARLPERIAARRARGAQRLRRIASRFGLDEDHLRQLMALGSPPVSVDLVRIVRAMMMDRLLLLLFGPMVVLLPLLVVPWSWVPWGWLPAVLTLAVWGWYAGLAREPTDPSEAMRHRARQIRELTKVPIVVMGHTHNPVAESDGTGFYFNTGTWVPSDPERAFTHVCIQRTEHGARAELRQWRNGAGLAYHAAGLGAFAAVPRSSS
jgi:UDP-2,3-diacylglucosamine pyrophosphatase LpxH